MFSKNKKFFIFGAVAIILIAAVFLYSEKSWTEELALYSHPGFKVSFSYPLSWDVDGAGGAFGGIPISFKGESGYFVVDPVAAAIDPPIDEVVNFLVFDYGKNFYGSKPTADLVTIDGMDARFVLPSSDQPLAANGE